MSRKFAAKFSMLHIKLQGVPKEVPQSIASVERYHRPLMRAYDVIDRFAPDTAAELADPVLWNRRYDTILQMECKSVNDAVGPDGLVPTILVYGDMKRNGMQTNEPHPNNLMRARDARQATEELSMMSDRSKVAEARRTGCTPNVLETRTMPLGRLTIVFRTSLNRWDGPFHLVYVRGDTVTLLLPGPKGPSQFHSTSVRPFVPDQPLSMLQIVGVTGRTDG